MQCYHGDIVTVDAGDSVCQWLVEDGGRIVFVGNELPDRYRGAKTVNASTISVSTKTIAEGVLAGRSTNTLKPLQGKTGFIISP